MKRTDIKIGQKVSFYFSGSKTKEREAFFLGEARTVHGVVHKIHRVNVEVWETLGDGSCTFYKKPSELTIEKNEATTTWAKETKARLMRHGYKFDMGTTLSKEQAIEVVIKMKSKLGRYTADNRDLAQNEIDYLVLEHNITGGDIWDYNNRRKK